MYADAFFHDEPQWSRAPGRRLALNFLPATLIVLGGLLALRLPIVEQAQPYTELLVRILAQDVVERVAPAEEPEPIADESPAAEPRSADLAPAGSIVTESRAPTDWYAQIPDAASAIEESPQYSINPAFDEKRRLAEDQFRPSGAPVERPVWENVERDTMGRRVLVNGDCQRVVDDPNVGSREAFLTFGQYIVSCANYDRPPQELAFVDEIKSRRANQARYGRQAVE